jgi:hypothetical protein
MLQLHSSAYYRPYYEMEANDFLHALADCSVWETLPNPCSGRLSDPRADLDAVVNRNVGESNPGYPIRTTT